MALITLKNDHARIVTPEQGIAIWRIMRGELKGTKKQMDFIRNVRKVYLNKATAPREYLEEIKAIPVTRLPYKD